MLYDAGIEVGTRISIECKSEENLKEDNEKNENENFVENKHCHNNTRTNFDYNDDEYSEQGINDTNTNHNSDHHRSLGTLGELRVSTVDAFQVKTLLRKFFIHQLINYLISYILCFIPNIFGCVMILLTSEHVYLRVLIMLHFYLFHRVVRWILL